VGPAVAALLGLVARAPAFRLLDHSGSGYRAVVTIAPGGRPTGAPFLDRPGSFAAQVRFSRGLGLPEPLPDVLRVDVKVIDAHGPGRHQDFLLVSSCAGPGWRHLAVPTTEFGGQPFSSLVPYLVGGRIRVFGVRPVGPPVRDGGNALAEVHVAAGRGELSLELAVAGEVGPWLPVGRLVVGELLDDRSTDALRFDPWRPGPGIRPVGPLHLFHRTPAVSGTG
jgi:hypothetical protein